MINVKVSEVHRIDATIESIEDIEKLRKILDNLEIGFKNGDIGKKKEYEEKKIPNYPIPRVFPSKEDIITPVSPWAPVIPLTPNPTMLWYTTLSGVCNNG